ncbi:acyl carrier protein [Mucilaginibacter phyllosphaerae]|uniref:Acyl carrier protein n=1 Tax=Mucilaginibacter phyllosphaerae TaxID=1812349 RepID=A0A4Y8AFV7_9SPHI|nr:acyl carrier protein [Mucilaginibacter phyllosphaerae]MBB3968724.1 acyl carrier protein [Mucilaginibacter phyllosphaerae]TEW67640.1 hypothetical protein E2R65_06525 [Mucilaginibacter phyllosphaerae]GGH14278.1 hypothetical protein GCM10007352_22260 [Mucilaginibacter phyllosphaerae]
MVPIYDEEAIRNWLIHRVSAYTQIPVSHIDIDEPVSETYAISSIHSVSLIGELQEYVGCKVSPIILYEYPTIADIAHFLANRDGVPLQLFNRFHLLFNNMDIELT